MTAQPISGLLGGPLSGWIMQRFQGVRHMAGWQWLFLLEALPAVIMGVAQNAIRKPRQIGWRTTL